MTTQVSIGHVVNAVTNGAAASQIVVPPGIATLAEGVYRSVLITKLKTCLVLILVGSITVLGAGGMLILTASAQSPKVASEEKQKQPAPPKNETDAAIAAIQQERAQVAEDGYTTANKLYRNARLGDAEIVAKWSQRWCEAQRAASKSTAEQIAAVEAHVNRMKELEQRATDLKLGAQGTQVGVNAAKFFRLEAEEVLLKLKRGRQG